MPDVYLTITIDTECDKDRTWRLRHPLSFRGIHEGIGARLQPLFERLGAVPTYLLSPEVMRDSESARLLASFGERAELGTHLHAELIEPEPDYETEYTGVMQNTLGPELEREKLTNLTTLFTETFSYRPTSFRAGRFGMGPHTLPILEDLGYVVDSSVAPFERSGDARWGSVDHTRALDRSWYHPSSSDPLVEGELSILEVPVTIGASFWTALPAGLRGPMMSSRLFGRTIRRIVGQPMRPTWLRPWKSTLEEMITLADGMVQRHERHGPVILVMMFHNMEVVAGCSPYPQDESGVERYMSDLEGLIEHARARKWRMVGLTEAARCVMRSGVSVKVNA